MALSYSLALLFGSLILMWPDAGNIEGLPHVWRELDRVYRLAVGRHCLSRHRYDVLNPFVDGGIRSLCHTVHAGVMA